MRYSIVDSKSKATLNEIKKLFIFYDRSLERDVPMFVLLNIARFQQAMREEAKEIDFIFSDMMESFDLTLNVGDINKLQYDHLCMNATLWYKKYIKKHPLSSYIHKFYEK